MADKARRLYWDTGCFICFLNRKEIERREVCESILRCAQEKKNPRVIIYTSTFTIAEVIYPKRSSLKNPKKLTREQITKITDMFKWKWLKKIEVDQRIAFKAVELSRDYDLLPSDAVHAATAILKGVDALQRWDRDFSRIASLVKVEEPTRINLQTPFPDILPRIGPHPDDFGSSTNP